MWQIGKNRKINRQTKSSFSHWFNSELAQTARFGSGCSQEPVIPSRSPTGIERPKVLGQPPQFPQVEEAGLKSRAEGLKLALHYGMLNPVSHNTSPRTSTSIFTFSISLIKLLSISAITEKWGNRNCLAKNLRLIGRKAGMKGEIEVCINWKNICIPCCFNDD